MQKFPRNIVDKDENVYDVETCILTHKDELHVFVKIPKHGSVHLMNTEYEFVNGVCHFTNPDFESILDKFYSRHGVLSKNSDVIDMPVRKSKPQKISIAGASSVSNDFEMPEGF